MKMDIKYFDHYLIVSKVYGGGLNKSLQHHIEQGLVRNYNYFPIYQLLKTIVQSYNNIKLLDFEASRTYVDKKILS